jgi:hypothetical protein
MNPHVVQLIINQSVAPSKECVIKSQVYSTKETSIKINGNLPL